MSLHNAHIRDVHKIKQISFDFWNTLAIPNLAYSKERTRMLATSLSLEESEAKRLYTSTKRFLDTAAELTGFGTTRENALHLMHANRPGGKVLCDSALRNTGIMMDGLFSDNRPTIPAELPGLLRQLSERGIGLNILSNTNFTRGETLRECVLFPAFGDLFDFMLFSDEHELAKPHTEFFGKVFTGAQKRHGYIYPSHILHIGDNEITDVFGANRMGMSSMLVEDPNDLVTQLKNLIAEIDHA